MSIAVLGVDEIARLLTTADPDAVESLLCWRDEVEEGDYEIGPLNPEALGLYVLGTGACAVVLLHPDDEGLVIRVCEESDGWVGYVCDGAPNPHKPTVLSLGWAGNCWVAVCECFKPISREEAAEFEESFWVCEDRDRSGPPATQMEALFEDIEARGLAPDNVCRRNILRRADGTIVLNDPVSVMPFRLMMDLKDRFDASREPESFRFW